MKITKINVSSSITIPIKDKYYKFSFGLEAELNEKDKIEKVKKDLWNMCNSEVDNQVQIIIDSYKTE